MLKILNITNSAMILKLFSLKKEKTSFGINFIFLCEEIKSYVKDSVLDHEISLIDKRFALSASITG